MNSDQEWILICFLFTVGALLLGYALGDIPIQCAKCRKHKPMKGHSRCKQCVGDMRTI
jgi:hypothetical protein